MVSVREVTMDRRVIALLVVLASSSAFAFQRGAGPGGAGARVSAPPVPRTNLDNAGPLADAPQDTRPLTFSSRVEYILVPVVVTGSDKKHVPGLTVDDFALTENGKQQRIASVEEIRADSKLVGRVPNRGAIFTNRLTENESQKKLTIIAFDLVNTSFPDQAYARRALLSYLGKIDPNDPGLYEVVVISKKGLRILYDFTSDIRRLTDAVQRFNNGEIKGNRTTDAAQNEAIAVAPGAGLADFLGSASASDLDGYFTALFAEDTKLQQSNAIEDTLSAFTAIAQSVQGVPGRKSLVWITASFPFSLDGDNYLGGGQPGLYFERTMQLMTNANIAVYPVDARGLVAVGLPDATVKGSTRNLGDPAGMVAATYGQHASTISTMEQVAQMTGGKAFYNRNDIDNSIKAAADDSDSYYMLTYALNKEDRRPGWRKLGVRVKKDGVHTRARQGFFLTNAVADPATSRHDDIMQALRAPVDYTALPTTIRWKDISGDGSKRKVTFEVVLAAAAAQVDTSDANHLNVDFVAIATDAAGKQVAEVSQRIDSKLKDDGVQQVKQNGITYTNSFEVPLGDYTVHFVVRDNITGKTGSVIAPLKVT
jgi:VWFA-related protein